jgi:polar amino acid transport system substrate-binding protein
MKKCLFSLWVWVVAAAMVPVSFERPPAMPSIALALPRGELRIGIDPSLPPFAFIVDEQLQGFDVDFGNVLGQRLSTPVRFVLLGYDGVYDALYTDQVDLVIASLIYDSSRLDRVLYTPPYFDAGLVMVTLSYSEIANVRDIGGQRLGYMLGSSGHAEADRWARRVLPFDRRSYLSEPDALDGLTSGEADAAFVDAVAARLYARQHPPNTFRMTPMTQLPYVIAIRGQNAPLAVLITATLHDMHSDGSLDVLLARWL